MDSTFTEATAGLPQPGRAVDDLPLLAIDGPRLQAWGQLILQVGELVKTLRENSGKRRWEPSADAAARHDEAQRSAEAPAVRPLSPRETTLWSDLDEEHTTTRHGFDPLTGHGLRVRYGRLDTGRWVLDAQIDDFTTDSTRSPDPAEHSQAPGRPVAAAKVSCASEQHVEQLARELLDAGPDQEVVRTLARHAAEREARHAQATEQVREEPAARLHRVGDAIREHWQPELARRVLASPAFGRLAERLADLEARGATLPEVLRRVDQAALLRQHVRDPAALAAWMCQSLVTVLDAEVATPTSQHERADQRRGQSPNQDRDPRGRPTPYPRKDTAVSRPSAPEPGSDAAEQEWLAGLAADVVWPALRSALPNELATRVRGGVSYEALAADLAARHATGWNLEVLLTALPIERISAERDPSRALRGLLTRRAHDHGGPDRTGVDQHAMARLVREGLPAPVARQVLECAAWPALARRMATATGAPAAGEPFLPELLRRMPSDSIAAARKPAAYAAELLRRELAARRGPEAFPDPATEDTRLGRGPAATATLNPDSPIDRIALDDLTPAAPTTPVAGVSLTAPAPGQGTTREQAPTEQLRAGRPDPTQEAATHQHAATQQLGIAADAEQGAARERGAGDTDIRGEGEPNAALAAGQDPTGDQLGAEAHAAADIGQARVDDNLAAGARAAAAEEMGSAAASALRAQVLLTPPTPAPAQDTTTTATLRPQPPSPTVRITRAPGKHR